MRYKPSITVSRLSAYLEIPATRITHLLECENKRSYRVSKIIISRKGGGACEDAAKSPNKTNYLFLFYPKNYYKLTRNI